MRLVEFDIPISISENNKSARSMASDLIKFASMNSKVEDDCRRPLISIDKVKNWVKNDVKLKIFSISPDINFTTDGTYLMPLFPVGREDSIIDYLRAIGGSKMPYYETSKEFIKICCVEMTDEYDCCSFIGESTVGSGMLASDTFYGSETTNPLTVRSVASSSMHIQPRKLLLDGAGVCVYPYLSTLSGAPDQRRFFVSITSDIGNKKEGDVFIGFSMKNTEHYPGHQWNWMFSNALRYNFIATSGLMAVP